jgi:hypothetical protein
MVQLLDEASKKELDLRIEAKNQSIISQNILNEKTEFKVHVTNEWYRIAGEYRENLRKGIDAFYRESLQNKTPYSDKLICDCQVFISAFLPVQMVKFQPQYLTTTEMEIIYYGIEKYNHESDLQKALDQVPARFQNYENDLANSEDAIQAIIDAANRREAEVIKAITIETATNTLIAQAETVTIETPKVKTEMKVVVVESEAWAKAVIMNFIKIWPSDKLRVKSWSKLTLGQMAEALAKLQLGRDWLPEIGQAQNAIYAMAQRGVSGKKFLFTGEELGIVQTILELHDEQLKNCPVRTMEEALDVIAKEYMHDKMRRIEPLETV